MKKLIFAFLVLLPILAMGQSQGVSMRATNGVAYNPTNVSVLTLRTPSQSAIIRLVPSFTGGFGRLSIGFTPGGSDVTMQDGEVTADRFIGSGITTAFDGNAGGLSNAVNIIAGSGMNVVTGANLRSFTLIVTNLPGEVTFQSNAYFYQTNFVSHLFVTNTSVFNGKVTINNQLFANGQDITNIFEKNVVVTTNTWGNAVVDFSLGTSIETNLAGNLTITGIAGFVTSNLNWQTISLNPNGADRVIAVPNEWLVSGFTNATTVTLPATNWGILRVECIVNRRTNASLEIYYP